MVESGAGDECERHNTEPESVQPSAYARFHLSFAPATAKQVPLFISGET